MKVLFCTIVSKHRLHQCVGMYHSLRRFVPEAVLVVLSLDKECKEVLEALCLPGLAVISAYELEDNELKELRQQRSESEYCWTLKPVLLLHLYESFKDTKIFAYFDTDIFFFDNPMRLFGGKGAWSVLFTSHIVDRRANGGFVAFMRGHIAYEALKWWKERCLDWCCSYYDNGRFADQGYLDLMRMRFKGVMCLKMPGANIATWNYYKYDLEMKNESIYLGKYRLIFYHFSGLRLRRIAGSTLLFGAEVPCVLCGTYSAALRAAISEVEKVDKNITDYFYLGI